MSLYSRFIAGVVFPIQERLKGHTSVRRRKQLEASQWLSRGEIDAIALENLKRFLVDIYEQVPYYRSLFDQCDFDPRSVKSLSDLEKLPLLDKQTIRDHTDELKAQGATELSRFNTGGSSGEPLIFYLDNERVSHDVAAKWRATRWWDVDIGDQEIVVWGSPIELGAQDRVRLARDKLFRSRLLSAFELSEDNMARFIQTIIDVRPKMLFGYPSVISMLACYAREQGIAMNTLGVKVVFVTSECLYDHQRRDIESVFECPVANGYGGRDAGFLAHQCPQGSLHLSAEDIIVEIVDKDGKTLPVGEQGEIVVTHTATRGFPFVRYRTGDVGRLSSEPCSCGRGLPVLAEVYGRTTDFIAAQNGTLMHGLSLIYVLRDIEGIESFKIIQTSLDAMVVKIVRGNGFDQTCEQTISSVFKQRLGAGVQVSFEYCESIAPEASGKYRYVVSQVA